MAAKTDAYRGSRRVLRVIAVYGVIDCIDLI
jgi:hypothetical protein